MKKLFTTLIIANLLGSQLFAGFYVEGTIAKVSTRSDGASWISVKRKSNATTTKLYKLAGNGDALKAMQATVLSAKLTVAPIQLYWENDEWHRVELLP